MNVTDYDNNTSTNYTDYDNITSTNCTNSENIFEIRTPLFTKIPCSLSLICLLSLMVYTLIKPLFKKKVSKKFWFIHMWRCDICEKVIYEQFKSSHLQSAYHKRLANSIVGKYIITNPQPNKIEDTIRKYFEFHYRKNQKILITLSMKFLLPSNQIKNVRRQNPCHLSQMYF